MASQKVASSCVAANCLVIAARTEVRFIPRNLRALDLTIFTREGYKCLAIPLFDFLRTHQT
jgi:hypothetical protein